MAAAVYAVGLWTLGTGAVQGALAQDTKVIRIGAGPTGITDFPFGGLIANAISNPPGSRDCARGGSCGVPGLIAVAQTTGDVIDNLRAVARGDLEMGLAPADVTVWAAQGSGAFAQQEPLSNLRIVARLYPENVHLITRKDSPIKAVTDLKGKRVAVGPEGSGTAATARFIMSAYGVKAVKSGAKANAKLVYMDFAAMAEAFAKGSIDAAFVVSGAPTLAVEDIAARTPIKLVPISGPVAQKLAQTFPFYSGGVIPSGSYTGQSAIETLDVGAVLVSRETMDPELAYGVARAIWHERNVPLFQAGHPRGKLMDKTQAARDLGVPIQTGADRYYIQNGLMDPAAAVPPTAKAPPASPKPKAERP